MSILCLSLCLSVFLEEDSDEIKIGTSCKNGGCTKVGECVTVYSGERSGINSHGGGSISVLL